LPIASAPIEIRYWKNNFLGTDSEIVFALPGLQKPRILTTSDEVSTPVETLRMKNPGDTGEIRLKPDTGVLPGPRSSIGRRGVRVEATSHIGPRARIVKACRATGSKLARLSGDIGGFGREDFPAPGTFSKPGCIAPKRGFGR